MALLAQTMPNFRPVRRAVAGLMRELPRYAGAARFFAGADRVHKKALHISLLGLLASAFYLPPLWAATTAGMTLTNTATASFQIGGMSYSKAATAAVVTDATIRFMAAAPNGSATPVGTSRCASNGATTGPFDLVRAAGARTAALAPTTTYGSGQAAYIEVVDYWANHDPAAIETVAVTVSGTDPADKEVVSLTETGPNTGVFVGAIQIVRASAVPNDCELSAHTNTRLRADYVFQHDAASTATSTTTAAARVDPFGTVFDSASGMAEDGATVTLIDASSGMPAPVPCDNGVQISPNPVVSGSTFTACGGTVTLPPGGYRFPLINAGTYRLKVEGLPGYTFASTVTPAALSAAPATAGYAVSG